MIKRSLLFASLLLVLMPLIKAQTFEFRYHGESLADGATVTIAAQEDEWGEGEMNCNTNLSDNPNNGLILKVLSGNITQGSATLVIEENTFNPERLLWCMGGTCMNLGSNTNITKPFNTTNGICQVQFEAVNIRAEGHLLATLTATMGSETHTVKIKFTYGEQDVPLVGDVNGDGEVTAADVTLLYNIILNSDWTGVVNADQNGDGEITAGDVTAVYNILLGS